MKGFIVCLLLVMTLGLAYAAYRDGTLDALLATRERVQYVERERETAPQYVTYDGGASFSPAPGTITPWMREAHAQVRERAGAWYAQCDYDWARRRGIIKTGIHDIDEAVAAADALTDLSGTWWPGRWQRRYSEGKRWVESEAKRDPGPSEECVDWQGRDQGLERRDARPEWIEPRRKRSTADGMSTGLRHWLFGVEPEERERNKL